MAETPRSRKQRDAATPSDDPAGLDPAVRLLRRFRMVFNAVKTHFQQVQRTAGIGGAQLWALSVINERPDIGVGGLAAAMDIHQSTASNLLKALMKSELVEAHRDGADRRALRLRITPVGRLVLRKAPGPFAGVLPDALAQLDLETLTRLDQDLGALLQKLQTDEHAARIPLANL